jgi:hypothetical protein
LATVNQPNITNVGTLGNLSVANGISAFSIGVNNLTAASYVNASSITATSGLTGTILTVAQPNITSVGTLSSLDVTGNITAGTFIGPVTGDITGNVSGSSATVTVAAQPAITSVGTLTSLTVSGNVVAGNINSGSGTIQTTGNIATTSNIAGTYLAGQVRTSAQPQITSVGSLTALAVNGTTTLVGATTFGSAILAAGAGSQAIGSATNRFGTVYSTTINNNGGITSGGFIGPIDGAIGTTTPATGTFTTVTANGLIWSTVGGVKFPDGSTQTTAATGGAASSSANTPNTLVLRDANGSFSANIITATSTTARYADLAEMYQADGQYEPGTVLVFGGNRDVTVTGSMADVSVAGVVSTAPAYLMNINEVNAVAVALRGKVPVKVMGPVRKGDLLVTSYTSGFAESVGKDSSHGVAIFAKSLTEDLTAGPKVIYAVII